MQQIVSLITVMPKNQLFNTSELKDMLMKLKFGSTGIYEDDNESMAMA